MNNIGSTRILLVEDSPDFLNLMKTMLTPMGFAEVLTAHNYESGLAAFTEAEPDVCLLDIDLGRGKSGIQLAETIRATHSRTPIIFLTAFYTEEQYERSRHTHPSSFMNKELSRLKLYQAIELALMRSGEKPQTTGVGVAPAAPTVITNDNYFFKVGDLYKAINIKEIAYFFADQRFTSARVQGRNYPTTVQLKTLAEELYPLFVRTHKAYLVNLAFITAIHPGEGAIEVAGETLPLGYAYRKGFMDSLRLIR